MGWLILWSILAVAATWFDWATTKRAIELGGREANPVAAWLFKRLGFGGKLAFDLTLIAGIAALFMWVASWEVTTVILIVLTLIQFFAGIHNKDVIEGLERKRK